MQNPILIFDHVKKFAVAADPSDPKHHKIIAEYAPWLLWKSGGRPKP